MAFVPGPELSEAMSESAPVMTYRSLAIRLLLFGGLWLLLTEGAADAWVVGLPAILAALIVSRRLVPPIRVRLVALLRFLPMFAWRSLAGAWDVALRAMRPGRPLDPSLCTYRTSLPDGLPRVFFANTVSLLPGTLSADLEGDNLCIHALDDGEAAVESLASLESAVASLFGPGNGR